MNHHDDEDLIIRCVRCDVVLDYDTGDNDTTDGPACDRCATAIVNEEADRLEEDEMLNNLDTEE